MRQGLLPLCFLPLLLSGISGNLLFIATSYAFPYWSTKRLLDILMVRRREVAQGLLYQRDIPSLYGDGGSTHPPPENSGFAISMKFCCGQHFLPLLRIPGTGPEEECDVLMGNKNDNRRGYKMSLSARHPSLNPWLQWFLPDSCSPPQPIPIRPSVPRHSAAKENFAEENFIMFFSHWKLYYTTASHPLYNESQTL